MQTVIVRCMGQLILEALREKIWGRPQRGHGRILFSIAFMVLTVAACFGC